MKRIYLVVVLSLFCGSALSQNPVKIKTSELIPMVERIGLDSTVTKVGITFYIYMIDPIVTKQLLDYVDKQDRSSMGYNLYDGVCLHKRWMNLKAFELAGITESNDIIIDTLTKKYKSLNDIDFNQEPGLMKMCKDFTTNKLLYNDNSGLWSLGKYYEQLNYSGIYISMIKLVNGDIIKILPLVFMTSQ